VLQDTQTQQQKTKQRNKRKERNEQHTTVSKYNHIGDARTTPYAQ
jgi:hypothetical protein